MEKRTMLLGQVEVGKCFKFKGNPKIWMVKVQDEHLQLTQFANVANKDDVQEDDVHAIVEDATADFDRMVRGISVGMAIMSHLSDAEHTLHDKQRAVCHIEFAKRLLLSYPNTNELLLPEELDEHWNTLFKS